MSWHIAARRGSRSAGVVLVSVVLLLCTSSTSISPAGADDDAVVGDALEPPSVQDGVGLMWPPLGGDGRTLSRPVSQLGGSAPVEDPAPASASPSGATSPPTPQVTIPGSSGTVASRPSDTASQPSSPSAPSPSAPSPSAPGAGADVLPSDGAVWCQRVSVGFGTTRSDGSIPVGAATMVVVPSAPVAGRTVVWSIASGGRVLAGGTTALDSAGGLSAPVTLPAGRATITTAMRLPGSVTETCPATVSTVTVSSPVSWTSGASGVGVADGSFAAWRGTPTPVAGTWADNNDAMVDLWQLRPGFEFGDWRGDLDIAVGAIGPGETWSAAAAGAYDARWRQSLTELARLWSGRPGRLHIRFAHEFNGNWYPWSVNARSVSDFRTAWIRYRALQQELFPDSELVFSPNSESASDLDWRSAFPGAQYVDVMAVDYYNMWPFARTAAEFLATSRAVDRYGAPRGLQRHAEFAASVGLPFAVAEWGNNAEFGDSPAYVEQMQAFFRAHAGPGPGQLVYEIYYNEVLDGNPFALYPATNAPAAAEAYRRVF